MRLSFLPGLIAPLLLSSMSISASAQTITGIKLNDSSSPPSWLAWDSIYGTNLFVGSGVYVEFYYPCSYGSGSQTVCAQQIGSYSPNEKYWYDSSTQINYYAYPNPNLSGYTPEAGCKVIDGEEICNQTFVCNAVNNN